MQLLMLWEYLTAFVLAATPWVELLVVIPLGIAWGLPPVPLAIVVLAGNTSTFLPIVWLHERWRRWRAERRRRRAIERGEDPENNGHPRSRRAQRAQRLWNRYGLPGLAMLAPLVTGVHLGTAMALLAGASRRRVIWWMMFSMVIWTVGVTILTLLGIEGVRRIWQW